MRIKVVNLSLTEIECDLLVVNLFEGAKAPAGATGAADKALGGQIARLIEQGEIDGKLGRVTIIHTMGKLPAERIAVIGLGKKEEFGLDEVRIASASAIRAAKEVKAKKVAKPLAVKRNHSSFLSQLIIPPLRPCVHPRPS